jgi:hypothetical protein
MPDPLTDETREPITVTDAARSYLAGQLERHAYRDTCFRLRFGSDQKMSTTLAEPSAGDVLVRFKEEVVLAIEPDLAERLQGNTIDIEPTDDGQHALIIL